MRVGKIKVPLGFYNESRDIDSLRTSILLPQSVYPEISRDQNIALQGFGIYGDIPLDFMGILSYQAQYGTMDIPTDSGAGKYIESMAMNLFKLTNIEMDELFVSALKWETPVRSLKIGGSFMKSRSSSDMQSVVPSAMLPAGLVMRTDTSYKLRVLSAEYQWLNVQFNAEYAFNTMENEFYMNSIPILPKMETDSEGYYVSASYRFTDWFELGACYSQYYPDKDDKDGNKITPPYPSHRAWNKDYSLTTRFDINQNWTVKLEGHSMNGTAILLPVDNPDGMDKNWFLFAAKTTFTF